MVIKLVRAMANRKIILLAHEDLYGGGTRQTFYIMRELVRQGYETVLVSNAENTWLGQTIREQGLTVKTYYTPLIQREIKPLNELQVLLYLFRVFWQEKPDVVFASGVKLIGLGGLVGWLCRVPHRIAIIRGEGAPPGSRMLEAIYAMERFVAILGMRFITVSDYIRQQMIQRGVASPESIVTIHDGIDPTDFQQPIEGTSAGIFTERFGLPSDAFKIGMIGRFVAGKRYDHFIELMRRLCEQQPHVVGVLIGEGEHRAQLEAQIQATGFADRILIAGYCTDMASVYRDLDVTVLLTDYEGCPNAILESFAAGVPVVASHVCGIPELIESGQNGYLVAPGNLEEASQAIMPLIADRALGYALGQQGRRTVMERFYMEHQVACLIEHVMAPPEGN